MVEKDCRRNEKSLLTPVEVGDRHPRNLGDPVGAGGQQRCRLVKELAVAEAKHSAGRGVDDARRGSVACQGREHRRERRDIDGEAPGDVGVERRSPGLGRAMERRQIVNLVGTNISDDLVDGVVGGHVGNASIHGGQRRGAPRQ